MSIIILKEIIVVVVNYNKVLTLLEGSGKATKLIYFKLKTPQRFWICWFSVWLWEISVTLRASKLDKIFNILLRWSFNICFSLWITQGCQGLINILHYLRNDQVFAFKLFYKIFSFLKLNTVLRLMFTNKFVV